MVVTVTVDGRLEGRIDGFLLRRDGGAPVQSRMRPSPAQARAPGVVGGEGRSRLRWARGAVASVY